MELALMLGTSTSTWQFSAGKAPHPKIDIELKENKGRN